MKRAQTTLASTGFEKYTKTTRRAQFNLLDPAVEEALYDSCVPPRVRGH